ncbi:MAG: hypothetical protein ABUK01_13180 [Leptospirales bacterium]
MSITDKNECEFPILEKMLDQETNLFARQHAVECADCQSVLMQTEGGLSLMKTDLPDQTMQDEMLEKVSLIADEYIKGDENTKQKIMESNADLENPAYFKLFQDLIYMVGTYNSDQHVPVPAHFNDFAVANKAAKEKPKEYLLDRIAVRIKEGVQVIGNHLDNVFTLTGEAELVPIRSNVAGEQVSNDMLCFYVNLEDQKKIVYNIMKDHTNRVMLTVKLQNFPEKPNSMNLKENGKIISTYPMKKDYAYFSKVEAGQYQIELQYRGVNSKTEIIPIDIIDK